MKYPWKRNRTEVKHKIAPAKIGLIAFLGLCLALLVWDMSVNGYIGSLTGEQPVVNLTDDPAELPSDIAAVTAPAEEMDVAEASASYFAAYRLDREQARSEELALLQRIIDDQGGSPTIREEAEQRRLAVASAIEAETQAESLLDAKGFGESVVMMGVDQATAIVSLELDAITAAQIAEIVSSACDIGYENVVIVNR
jgi:hypothetical protein